jgi:ATP-binding cassette, subfamily F, member 3
VLYCERLVIDSSARIGLLGQNGAGKSTLIRTLAGELPLLDGLRTAARTINIGYFAQHQLDQLRPDRTPLQHLSPLDPSASEQQLRDYLGGFGFGGDQAASPVAPFSGGEKARLVLALIVYQRPNLLLLDEPTNHLDLEMRQALALALQEFEGAMLLVSHDRHLLRSTADQLWLVHQGRVEEFNDSLDDYPAWLARQQAECTTLQITAGAPEQSALARKERKRQEAALRQQLQPVTRRVAELETRIEALSARQQELQAQLGDSRLYLEQAKPELLRLLADQAETDRQLQTSEEEWLAQQELLEVMRREGA